MHCKPGCHIVFSQLVNVEKSGNDSSQHLLHLYQLKLKKTCVLLGNVNKFNLNRLWLKWLILIEHEPKYC